MQGNEAKVQALGRRFASTVFALGGLLPMEQTYRLYRGKDATVDALLRQAGLIA